MGFCLGFRQPRPTRPWAAGPKVNSCISSEAARGDLEASFLLDDSMILQWDDPTVSTQDSELLLEGWHAPRAALVPDLKEKHLIVRYKLTLFFTNWNLTDSLLMLKNYSFISLGSNTYIEFLEQVRCLDIDSREQRRPRWVWSLQLRLPFSLSCPWNTAFGLFFPAWKPAPAQILTPPCTTKGVLKHTTIPNHFPLGVISNQNKTISSS